MEMPPRFRALAVPAVLPLNVLLTMDPPTPRAEIAPPPEKKPAWLLLNVLSSMVKATRCRFIAAPWKEIWLLANVQRRIVSANTAGGVKLMAEMAPPSVSLPLTRDKSSSSTLKIPTIEKILLLAL